MTKMKITFIVSLIFTLAMFALCILALFNIVDMSPLMHGIIGVGAVVGLAIFVKSFIHLRRYTSRDNWK